MGLPDYLLVQTVTRVRPALSTDGYGNDSRDYGAAADTKTMPAWLQQDKRERPLVDGRDPQIQRWLLMTNDSDIEPYDRIVWGELTFDLDGPPEPTYSAAGYHHTETILRAVTG